MRASVLIGLLALAGCATATEIENKSRIHSLRADAAAARRDYPRAAAEQAEAQRLHDKAVKRAYKTGEGESVIVPGDVPAPVNP